MDVERWMRGRAIRMSFGLGVFFTLSLLWLDNLSTRQQQHQHSSQPPPQHSTAAAPAFFSASASASSLRKSSNAALRTGKWHESEEIRALPKNGIRLGCQWSCLPGWRFLTSLCEWTTELLQCLRYACKASCSSKCSSPSDYICLKNCVLNGTDAATIRQRLRDVSTRALKRQLYAPEILHTSFARLVGPLDSSDMVGRSKEEAHSFLKELVIRLNGELCNFHVSCLGRFRGLVRCYR